MVIGLCAQRGAETMVESVRTWGIEYRVAKDVDDQTGASYHQDSFPDYYIIDREGRVVIADCKNGDVDKVIEMLLKR